MGDNLRKTSSNAFSLIVSLLIIHWCFSSNFSEVYSQPFNWQGVSTGSGNDLAPKRCQVIPWINEEQVLRTVWHYQASNTIMSSKISVSNKINLQFKFEIWLQCVVGNELSAVLAKLHRHISFCRCLLLNGLCWGKNFCIQMYWTLAKMLLLADVDKYSFANAAVIGWVWCLWL